MFDGLLIVSLIGACCQAIKEACKPTISAKNWANKKLIYHDRMNGISEKQFSENLANGKYKLNVSHPEPHRDGSGKIIIENYKLYNEDIRNYGAYQAMQWVEQGKYNLTPKEVKRQEEELKKKWEYLYSLV